MTRLDENRSAIDLVLVCTTMGLSFIAQTMLLLAVPLRAIELGLGPAAVGGLLSAPFWLPMFLAIPLGKLVSRIGAKRTMIIGTTGFVLGPWLAMILGGFTGLLATQLVIGITQIAMGLSAQSLVASLSRGQRLERHFALYTTCVSIGQLFGPLIGGFIIQAHGPMSVFPISGTLPLACLAAATLISTAATKRTMAPIATTKYDKESPASASEPRMGDHQHSGTHSGSRSAPISGLGYGSQLQLLRTNAAMQVSLIVTVAMMFAVGAHSAFFPIYLEGMMVPASVIGVLLSLRALCSIIVRLFMRKAINLLGGRFRTLVMCVALGAMGLMWTGATSSWLILGFFAALIGLGVGLALPLAMVTIADHVSQGERPAALGMRLTVNQAAQVLGPLLLGLVAEFAGYSIMFLVGGLVLIGLLVVLLRIGLAYSRLNGSLTSQ